MDPLDSRGGPMGKALRLAVLGFLVSVLTAPTPLKAAGDGLDRLLARLRTVGKEDAGNAEAQKAWRELVRRGPEVLPALLAVWDEADPVAANWLRTAVDAIAEREAQAGRPLPVRQLEAFVTEKRHAGAARRLA